MHHKLLTSLTGLMLPLAAYAMPLQNIGSYQRTSAASYQNNQRSYLAASRMVAMPADMPTGPAALKAAAPDGEPELLQANPVRELVIIDAAVPDKHLLYRDIKPGVEMLELAAG